MMWLKLKQRILAKTASNRDLETVFIKLYIPLTVEQVLISTRLWPWSCFQSCFKFKKEHQNNQEQMIALICHSISILTRSCDQLRGPGHDQSAGTEQEISRLACTEWTCCNQVLKQFGKGAICGAVIGSQWQHLPLLTQIRSFNSLSLNVYIGWAIECS